MRASRLVYVVFLSSLLLVPPVSSDQGKGQGQGRGKERVERVEKDRDGKRGQGKKADKGRGGERERGRKAEKGRGGEQRLDALREQRRADERLRERDRDRLSRLVTSVRERRDDDRSAMRVRFRDRDRRAEPAPMRFRGLDRDRDGRIARREWRGNQVSFRNHDWNRDGRLSGAEVIPGARRPLRFDRPVDRVRVVRREVRLDPIFTFRSDPFGHRVVLPPAPLVTRVDRVFLAPAPVRFERLRPAPRVAPGYYYPYGAPDDALVLDLGVDLDDRFGLLALPATLMLADALVDDVDVVVRSGRFAAFDGDLDGYVTPVEWPAGRRSFRDYDRDGDLLLVRDELYHEDDLLVVDRDRFLLFHGLDRDDDGLIAPWEWPGDLDSFFLRDFNGDAVIGLDELMGLVEVDYGVRDYGFDALDFDRGGTVTRVEWVGDPVRFTRLDRNDNGVVGRWEYGVGYVLAV